MTTALYYERKQKNKKNTTNSQTNKTNKRMRNEKMKAKDNYACVE